MASICSEGDAPDGPGFKMLHLGQLLFAGEGAFESLPATQGGGRSRAAFPQSGRPPEELGHISHRPEPLR